VVSFTPWQLYLWGKKPHTHLVGSWVGPRADSDILEDILSFETFSRKGTKDSPFCSRFTNNRDMKECEFEVTLELKEAQALSTVG
jgi:hypothetical protein